MIRMPNPVLTASLVLMLAGGFSHQANATTVTPSAPTFDASHNSTWNVSVTATGYAATQYVYIYFTPASGASFSRYWSLGRDSSGSIVAITPNTSQQILVSGSFSVACHIPAGSVPSGTYTCFEQIQGLYSPGGGSISSSTFSVTIP